MGKAVNKVFLIGRLTNDVELRATPQGKNVADFTLAVDKASPAPNGPTADFFDVVAWEKLAELVDQYCGKGSKIHVEGSLQQQTWEQDGKKRSKIVVVARDVTFLDSKADSQQTNTQNKTADVVPEDVDDKPVDLSEIPF